MHPKLRAFLEANGLRAAASEKEAWKYYKKLQGEGIEYQGPENAEPAAAATDHGPEAPPVREDAAVQIEAEIQRGIAEDRLRCRAIEDIAAVAGLGADTARSMIDRGLTVDQARAEAFENMRASNPPIGSGSSARVQVGIEAGEKFRSAALDGLLIRSGIRVENPADGHREFRGHSLLDIARMSFELAGVSTRGMTRNQLALRALTPAGSSDFPLLMSQLSGKVLVAAYNEWPATWRPWVAVGSAVDFKDIHGIKLSESPDLMDLDEHGEFKTAEFSEKQENYRVSTKGRKIKLTRVMLINDDLRAFTRIPQLFGTAARRMESDMVYSLLTSNPVMGDGRTLFHADHKNLDAAAALSTDSLSSTRTLMRRQTGMSGAGIDVTPAFLLVPVELETAAEVMLRSVSLPEDNKSAGVYNPWAGKLTPIAEPRLSGVSATAFYVLAHPNQVPTIEVSWLEGEEQPYVDSEIEFGTEAMSTVVRHDFGAGVVDHVGAVYNAGA